ncbi:MAG: putative peroxidase-related enzyme [Saprospiraceae bacterium]
MLLVNGFFLALCSNNSFIMKNPLVNPLDKDSNPELQEMVDFYNETLGFTPNSLFTMMHRPRIASAFLEMNQAVMENKGRVTSALKRLIAYLSSMTTGCRYCEAHAIRAAERYGAEQEQMENIWEYKTHPAFSDAERAAFDLTIAASAVPNAVDDVVAENMRKHWEEGEIVEIMGVIALFGYLNRWNDSMGTQLEKPAADSAEKLIAKKGDWEIGKHGY